MSKKLSRRIISHMDVKKANRNQIYKLIHRSDGISKPEIAHQLKISLPTVMQNVKSLMEMGFIEEIGNQESTGGRKPVAIAATKDARYALGVEITRNHIAVVAINMYGNTVSQGKVRLPFADSGEYNRIIGEEVGRLLDSAAIDRSRIIGAGVSIPGVLSPENDRLITSHVLLVDDYRFSDLTKAIGFPAVYLNDANAAGYAEIWAGADRDFIYIALSNSVGGALVMDKKLRLGDNQRCAELGHMTLERGGLRCYCGKKGCLDPYCCASVLSAATEGDLSEFFKRLKADDGRLKTVWADYLDYLATAVNTLRMVFDYDIIIGGYVGSYIDDYMTDLRAKFSALSTFNEKGDFIRPCKQKNNASAIGAALLVLDHYINDI